MRVCAPNFQNEAPVRMVKLFAQNYVPPLDPVGKLEVWTVVDDGLHNAFTDLIHWRGYFWLAYVSSPSHFGNRRSRVIILRSKDAREWQKIIQFSGNGEDIRDPKLAEIKGRLFLYALLNNKFEPEPYKTVTAYSNDGATWSPLADVTPTGWLLRRPLTADSTTWFAPAHHIEYGASVLFASKDGITWDRRGSIHTGERADETSIHILENGQMVAVTRLEVGSSIFGHRDAGTLISYADAPYTSWTPRARNTVTRLDGSALFRHMGRIFAVGRRQVTTGGPFRWQGSAFSRERCALYLVIDNEDGLVHLLDLPSSGDTSYPGVVIENDKIFISYYTNNTENDMPWLLGMLSPTRIQIAMFVFSNSSFLQG